MQKNHSDELLHSDGTIKGACGILSHFGHIHNYIKPNLKIIVYSGRKPVKNYNKPFKNKDG